MQRNRINSLTTGFISVPSVCSVVKNGFLCGCIDG